MSTDLEAAFDAAIAAAGDGGGVGDDDFVESPNAERNMGDSDEFLEDEDADVSTETDDEGDEDDSDDDDTDDGATDDSQFDLAKFKDQKVTIKVNGQERQITLQEAINGSMLHADYTQKTQQLSELRAQAEWGARLQQAFQTDPQGTIQYLQQAFQVQAAAETDPYGDIDPEFTPLVNDLKQTKAELARMQQALAAQEDARIMAEVKAEVQAVRDEFPDFDANSVLPVAAERGLSIRDAYLLTQAETIMAKGKASKMDAAKAEKIVEKEAAKRANAKKIAPGGSRQVSSKKAQMPEFDSFEDMLEWNMSHAR
jgi:hypothetical protein